MLINFLEDTDGSRCTLTFEEADQWIRATWTGHVDAIEAMRGADNYLMKAGPFHCPFLLNDNVGLHGSWFDSVEWLERAWLPYALQLGLRYVAQVVQADRGPDLSRAGRRRNRAADISPRAGSGGMAAHLSAEYWLACALGSEQQNASSLGTGLCVEEAFRRVSVGCSIPGRLLLSRAGCASNSPQS